MLNFPQCLSAKYYAKYYTNTTPIRKLGENKGIQNRQGHCQRVRRRNRSSEQLPTFLQKPHFHPIFLTKQPQ
jgi:hypothetical protein